MILTRIIGRVLLGVGLVVVGAIAGSVIGLAVGSRFDVEGDTIPTSLVYAFFGWFLGGLAGFWLGLGEFRPGRVFENGDNTRYEIRIHLEGRIHPRIVDTTAIILGIDRSRARKIVESDLPVRTRARRSEVNLLRRMFADWGIDLRFDPPLAEEDVKSMKSRG